MYEKLTDIVTRLEILSDEVMQINSANISHRRTTFSIKLMMIAQKVEELQKIEFEKLCGHE